MHYLSKDLCGNILKGITNQGSTNPASNNRIHSETFEHPYSGKTPLSASFISFFVCDTGLI